MSILVFIICANITFISCCLVLCFWKISHLYNNSRHYACYTTTKR